MILKEGDIIYYPLFYLWQISYNILYDILILIRQSWLGILWTCYALVGYFCTNDPNTIIIEVSFDQDMVGYLLLQLLILSIYLSTILNF